MTTPTCVNPSLRGVTAYATTTMLMVARRMMPRNESGTELVRVELMLVSA
jgi:hypothetical protein